MYSRGLGEMLRAIGPCAAALFVLFFLAHAQRAYSLAPSSDTDKVERAVAAVQQGLGLRAVLDSETDVQKKEAQRQVYALRTLLAAADVKMWSLALYPGALLDDERHVSVRSDRVPLQVRYVRISDPPPQAAGESGQGPVWFQREVRERVLAPAPSRTGNSKDQERTIGLIKFRSEDTVVTILGDRVGVQSGEEFNREFPPGILEAYGFSNPKTPVQIYVVPAEKIAARENAALAAALGEFSVPKTQDAHGGYWGIGLEEPLAKRLIYEKLRFKEDQKEMLIFTPQKDGVKVQMGSIRKEGAEVVPRELTDAERNFHKRLIRVVTESFDPKLMREVAEGLYQPKIENFKPSDVLAGMQKRVLYIDPDSFTVGGGYWDHAGKTRGRTYAGGLLIEKLAPREARELLAQAELHHAHPFGDYGHKEIEHNNLPLQRKIESILEHYGNTVAMGRIKDRRIAAESLRKLIEEKGMPLRAGLLLDRGAAFSRMLVAWPDKMKKNPGAKGTAVFIIANRVFIQRAEDLDKVIRNVSGAMRRAFEESQRGDLYVISDSVLMRKGNEELARTLLHSPAGGYTAGTPAYVLPDGMEIGESDVTAFAQKIAKAMDREKSRILVRGADLVFEVLEGDVWKEQDKIGDSPLSTLYREVGLSEIPLLHHPSVPLQAVWDHLDWMVDLVKTVHADGFLGENFQATKNLADQALAAGRTERPNAVNVKAVTIDQIEQDFADPRTAALIEGELKAGVRYLILSPKGEDVKTSRLRLAKGNFKKEEWFFNPRTKTGRIHIMPAIESGHSVSSVDMAQVVGDFKEIMRSVIGEAILEEDVFKVFVDPAKPDEVTNFVAAFPLGMRLDGTKDKNKEIRYFITGPNVRLSETLSVLQGLFTQPLDQLLGADSPYRQGFLNVGYSDAELDAMAKSPHNPIQAPQTFSHFMQDMSAKKAAESLVNWTS